MKKMISVFLVVLSFYRCGGHDSTITVSGAWALYPMMVQWAEEYKAERPDVRIDISAGGAGKGMSDVLGGMVHIGMISREIFPEEVKKGAYPFIVAKDAVVPVVNAGHPAIKELMKKGVTKEEAMKIWTTPHISKMVQAVEFADSTCPLRVYTRSDACGAAKTWAAFFHKEQDDLKGVGIYGDPGLLEAVRNDKAGVGYNNLNYVYDFKTGRPHEGIRVLPIDFNNNGVLDSSEKVYENKEDLMKAVKEGRYPTPPARFLYLVTKGKPNDKKVSDFIKWILQEGRKSLGKLGYIAISDSLKNENINKLGGE